MKVSRQFTKGQRVMRRDVADKPNFHAEVLGYGLRVRYDSGYGSDANGIYQPEEFFIPEPADYQRPADTPTAEPNLAQLQRENAALREALERARNFTEHRPACRMSLGYPGCNCGFSKMDSQAVAALAESGK